jgi:hypothetical protein
MAVFQELKRSIAISPTDWDLLQELNVTLKPFLTATEFLSGQNYVSISGVAPVVCNLIAKLTKMNHQQESATALTADDSDLNQQPPDRLADFRVKIISQLSSRWDFKSNPGNGFLIAAALDPRFRSLKFLKRLKVQAQNLMCALFSEAGAIADRKRATMSPEHVDMLTCLHHNLSSFGVSTTTTEGMDLVD